MKISVVIPVYNAEKTIERLLNSIEKQTYSNYEIIVVNDGSTDNTNRVLEKYNYLNMKIINQKNYGVGKARKEGFKHITGDLVFFCDSDDYIANNKVFETIIKVFEEVNPDILMFDVLDILLKDKTSTVNCFSKKMQYGMHNINELDDSFVFGPLFLKIFKREKLDEDCFIEHNNFEDTYTTYLYFNNCKNFYYLNDIFYVYDETANEKSLTKIKSVNKFIKTIDLIKIINDKCKLKGLCSITAFNYYLHLINIISEQIEWKDEEIKELELKQSELEKIFLPQFEFIKKNSSKEKIDKYFEFKNTIPKKKIIFIDGISTTGKSTISQLLYRQLNSNYIDTKWYHEESDLSKDLIIKLPKHDKQDIDTIRKEMNNLKSRWKEFLNSIQQDKYIYIIDSNFFKHIHDYFLNSDLKMEEIVSFYNDIISSIDKEKSLFVMLKRDKIKNSFEKAFSNRGDFWKNKYTKFVDERVKDKYNPNRFFQYQELSQRMEYEVFKRLNSDKICITTDKEEWYKYVETILNSINIGYIYDKEATTDFSKYLGEYSCENWNVEIYQNNNKLYLSAFWPNIELKYLGDDTFQLERFPLQLKYKDNTITFIGELTWDMKDKKFIKQKRSITYEKY